MTTNHCPGCDAGPFEYRWLRSRHIAAGQTYNDPDGAPLSCDPTHPVQVRWRREHGLETDLERLLSQSIQVIQEARR